MRSFSRIFLLTLVSCSAPQQTVPMTGGYRGLDWPDGVRYTDGYVDMKMEEMGFYDPRWSDALADFYFYLYYGE